jgi:hypothetical protein
LPWRWKTVYLQDDLVGGIKKALLFTKINGPSKTLPDRLEQLVGKSWFLTNLIGLNDYVDTMCKEFLFPNTGKSTHHTIPHPLGQFIGLTSMFSNGPRCHIYRKRNLFSLFKYCVLKHCSSSWKEVNFKVGTASEKILIQKSDEATLKFHYNCD